MNYNKFEVVKILKSTRGKSYEKKAVVGESYLITSLYTTKFGTTKLYLVNEKCEPFFSTESCVEKLYSVDNLRPISEKWLNVKKEWMSENYIPIVVSHFYNSQGFPLIETKDSSAVLVSDIRNSKSSFPNQFWLNKSLIHDDDIITCFTSSLPPNFEKKGEASSAFSVRVPKWFAKKVGIFG